MKKLCLLLIILVSCKNREPPQDYNLNEFYEVQGIVYESEEVKPFFGESTWDVKYFFEINGQSYYGEQKGFYVPIIVAHHLIILVHKENPKINFFKEIGVLIE